MTPKGAIDLAIGDFKADDASYTSIPAMDFSQEMIVAAALGTRNSGGYNILLAQAAEDGGVVQILVVETSPGGDCLTTGAVTHPIDLARMARHDGTVDFVVTKRTDSCGR